MLKTLKNDLFLSKNVIFHRFQPHSEVSFPACTTLVINNLQPSVILIYLEYDKLCLFKIFKNCCNKAPSKAQRDILPNNVSGLLIGICTVFKTLILNNPSLLFLYYSFRSNLTLLSVFGILSDTYLISAVIQYQLFWGPPVSLSRR